MTHSGLFKDDFVHQVQVVAYFHEWKATATRGGQFLYWKDNATVRVVCCVRESVQRVLMRAVGVVD